MVREKLISRGISAWLIILVILQFSACFNRYTPAQYKKAIENAYSETLEKYGISITGLVFVLKYDSEPLANAVGLFYTRMDQDSFQALKEHFHNPQQLHDWLVSYIKKYIEIKEVR